MGSSKGPDWDELFMTAAFQPDLWPQSLDVMAQCTRSTHGQLIGLGADRDVPFNLVTQFKEPDLATFIDIGGSSPELNFRIAAAQRQIAAGNYDQIVHEAHYNIAIPALASSRYVEWCEEVGIPYGCQSNLVVDGSGLIGLAVLRNRKDGQTTAADRAVFDAATQAARRAVRLQERLEGHQAQLLAGALEAIGICAFLVDRRGCLLAHTIRAEGLLSSGTVQMKDGILNSRGAPISLQEAITALVADTGGLSHVRLSGDFVIGGRPVLFEGFRLPIQEWSLGKLPRAIIIANPPRGDRAGVTSFLMTLYGLTSAEADIAMRLMDGRSRSQISADRQVTAETLKGQIKSLYQKVGVGSEAALIRMLAGLIA